MENMDLVHAAEAVYTSSQDSSVNVVTRLQAAR
jgi:hypothetical protein